MDCPLPPPQPHHHPAPEHLPVVFLGLEGAQPSVPPGSVSVCRAGVGLGQTGSWKAGLSAAASHTGGLPPPPPASVHPSLFSPLLLGAQRTLAPQPQAAGVLRGRLAFTCVLTPSPGLPIVSAPAFSSLGPAVTGSALSLRLSFSLSSEPHPLCLPRAQPHPIRSLSPGNVFLLLISISCVSWASR